MKIYEFIEHFPNENACKIHFKKLRETEGIHCKKCGNSHHYWLKAKWQWQCKKCRFRTTLRSGTGMQHAHLPFRKWYLCIALMSFSKKGLSAKETQRQLQHSRYRSIWALMQKVRFSLSKNESELQMKIFHFIKTHHNLQPKPEVYHHQKFSLDPNFNSDTHCETDLPGVFRARTIILCAGNKSRIPINDCYSFNYLFSKTSIKPQIRKKWENIIRSNFNRLIFGVHHHISLYYIRNYLSEYSFRLNNRNKNEDIFELFLVAVVNNRLW